MTAPQEDERHNLNLSPPGSYGKHFRFSIEGDDTSIHRNSMPLDSWERLSLLKALEEKGWICRNEHDSHVYYHCTWGRRTDRPRSTWRAGSLHSSEPAEGHPSSPASRLWATP
jgi:hypothetical protein